MGHVNILKSWSTHNRLFKSNVLHYWASRKAVRNSPILLGLSATVVLGCFGIQAFRHSLEALTSKTILNLDSWPPRKTLRLRLQPFYKHISLENISVTRKRFENGGLSLLNSVLTPVLCSGVDIVCHCNEKKSTCEMAVANADNKSDKNCATVTKCVPATPACKQVEKPPCNTSSTTTACSKTPPKDSGCASSPKNSTSNCNTCANGLEVDLEAFAAKLGLKQVEWIEKSDLSHCHLLRQASQVTVDSVTRILTETASAYEDCQIEYRRILDMMLDALEASRRACGADLEVLECKIVLIRAKLDEMKRKIEDIEMFLCTLEKLANAAAETAFMANGEYASIAISERLHSLNLEVKRLRSETKEKERDMLELQALIIVETGKSLK